MRLYDDQIESHMRPCKLGKLESVVALLEGSDEEDEACTKISLRRQFELRKIEKRRKYL